MKKFEYRPDIDGLRALAVAMVVVFHAFPKLLPSGFIGVDIFFVISGYLITGLVVKDLDTDGFSLADFYHRRVKRLLPTLLIVLISVWMFGNFVLFRDEMKTLGKHIGASILFTSNFMLWAESGYFDSSSDLKPLLHLWSLSIEEQFYLLWPLLLMLLHSRRSNLRWPIMALIVASFLGNVSLVWKYPSMVFYFPTFRAWELLAGSFLAIREREKSSSAVELASLRSWVGFALIVVSLVFMGKGPAFPGWWALLPVLGTFLILQAGKDSLFNSKILSRPSLVFVGLLSYPLYLWHWPILSFARIIEGKEPTSMVKAILLGMSVALSYLTWRFVEWPVKKLVSLSAQRRLVKASLILFLLVGGAGLTSYTYRGGIQSFQTEAHDLLPPLQKEERCIKSYPFLGTDDSFCRLSDGPGPLKVALLGDSHALVLFSGLANYFQKFGRGVMMLGHAGCLPFLELASFSRNQPPSRCAREMTSAIKAVGEDDGIETVVLHMRAGVYLTSEERFLRNVVSGEKKNKETLFEEAFEKTIRYFDGRRKKIVFIHQAPELKVDPKTCLNARPLKFSKADCSIDYEKVKSRQKSYREIVERVLAKFPNVQTFDPVTHLCDAGSCFAEREGTLFYRDKNHLTEKASLFFSDKFEFLTQTVQK